MRPSHNGPVDVVRNVLDFLGVTAGAYQRLRCLRWLLEGHYLGQVDVGWSGDLCCLKWLIAMRE